MEIKFNALNAGMKSHTKMETNVLRVCAVRGENGKKCRNGKQYEDK